MTPEQIMDWLRRYDGRIEDIFGLWVQGKRDDRWVAETLLSEGHIAALAASPAPDPGAGLREALAAYVAAHPHWLDDDEDGCPESIALRAALAPSAEPPETA